jgi:DNA polymerase III epsilon subunit family exonuclease
MKKLIPAILILLAHAGFAAALSDTTFVAFDVETTGFSPATERIIEIGAVKYRNGEIVKSTHWLINPGIPINNSFVHNITDEMIAGHPGFADTYKAFVHFVGDSVLIVHNASFDVRFMAAEIERNNLMPAPNPVVNSLALFRKWYPQAPEHKLGVLAVYLKFPTGAQHRAEDDAETLLRILRHGMAERSNLTLQQIKADSNGFYYFDGSRK